ncbi:MAG: T9SS type A sorting domain-containing protein, partial [Ignavibacteriaceae bacterium]
TLGGGVFKSQDYGFTWSDISIVDTNYFGVTALVPVYSLASIDTNIIAAAGPGYFYFTSFAAGNFVHTFSSSKYMPILCFAMQHAKLFAGNSSGNIFLSSNIGTIWYSLSPSLKNQVIYSLELNDTYIFAGTGDGVWRLRYPETTTNINNPEKVPTGFALEQNYPNPFNPSTTIKYSLPSSSQGERSGVRFVTLKVYNLLGKEVAMLVNEQQAPGNYEVKFNGSNLASGVYIYRLQAGNFVFTKKLMLLK